MSPSEEDIPVVSWKQRRVVNVPADDEVPIVRPRRVVNVPADDEVPIVKQRRVVNVPADDEVPIVKWKPPASEDSIPKVKWNPHAVSPLSDDEETAANEDTIPVVRWRPQTSGSPKAIPQAAPLRHSPAAAKPRNIPVKAILTYERKTYDDDQLSEESYGSSDFDRSETAGVLNGDSDLQVSLDEGTSEAVQRTSRYQAHHSGLPRPSGLSQSSLHRGTSPSGGHLPRQVRNPSPRGNPKIRSRSPSPSLHYSPQQPIIRSRSPSPSVRHGGGQLSSPLLRHSPQDARKQMLPPKASHSPRSLSPARSNIAIQPQTTTKLHSPGSSPILGRKLSGARTTPPTSTASPGRHPSGLPHHPSANSRTNLVTKPTTGSLSPGSRINSRSEGSPSSRVQRGAKSGVTPPGRQLGKPKRVLPTPPSTSGTKLPNGGRRQPTPQRFAISWSMHVLQ